MHLPNAEHKLATQVIHFSDWLLERKLKWAVLRQRRQQSQKQAQHKKQQQEQRALRWQRRRASTALSQVMLAHCAALHYGDGIAAARDCA